MFFLNNQMVVLILKIIQYDNTRSYLNCYAVHTFHPVCIFIADLSLHVIGLYSCNIVCSLGVKERIKKFAKRTSTADNVSCSSGEFL